MAEVSITPTNIATKKIHRKKKKKLRKQILAKKKNHLAKKIIHPFSQIKKENLENASPTKCILVYLSGLLCVPMKV